MHTRTKEEQKALKTEVSALLRYVRGRGKGGASGEDICSAFDLPVNFMGYRYRLLIREAKKRGLVKVGHSSATRYVVKKASR